MDTGEENWMISHGMGQETWWVMTKAQQEPIVGKAAVGRISAIFE